MLNDVQRFLQAHDPNGNWLNETDMSHLYNTLNLYLYDFEDSHKALFYINWLFKTCGRAGNGEEVIELNKAQQVYLNRDSLQTWHGGQKVVALKELPSTADPQDYKHINVAHDEVIAEESGLRVLIEKHY